MCLYDYFIHVIFGPQEIPTKPSTLPDEFQLGPLKTSTYIVLRDSVAVPLGIAAMPRY